MEVLRDNEEQVQCPYNAAHYIRKCRMDVHLKKCRKAYPESANFGICDFNASHRIPLPELQYHHCNCPSRKHVELQIFTEEGSEPIDPPGQPGPSVPVDTSWDTDVEVPSYDPERYCEANPILRRIDTESASTRRNFRISERLRFNNLNLDQSVPKPLSTSNCNKVNTNLGKVQLPPLPVSDVNATVEPTPDNVLKLLERTSILPKRAVITTTTRKSES